MMVMIDPALTRPASLPACLPTTLYSFPFRRATRRRRVFVSVLVSGRGPPLNGVGWFSESVFIPPPFLCATHDPTGEIFNFVSPRMSRGEIVPGRQCFGACSLDSS